jgi:hypothetical protein
MENYRFSNRPENSQKKPNFGQIKAHAYAPPTYNLPAKALSGFDLLSSMPNSNFYKWRNCRSKSKISLGTLLSDL